MADQTGGSADDDLGAAASRGRRPIGVSTSAVIGGRASSGQVTGSAVGPAARSAVTAARLATTGWAASTGHQRGMALYRLSRTVEARRTSFAAAGVPVDLVDLAVDRCLWYAGWADNTAYLPGLGFGAAQGLGGLARDCFTQPLGVACVIVADRHPTLALVDMLGPALVAGNTVVAIAGNERPVEVSTFCDALLAADLPAGAVNLVAGNVPALVGAVAADPATALIDLTGVGDPLVPEAARAALRSRPIDGLAEPPLLIEDPGHTWTAEPDPRRMLPFFTTKMMWYSLGY